MKSESYISFFFHLESKIVNISGITIENSNFSINFLCLKDDDDFSIFNLTDFIINSNNFVLSEKSTFQIFTNFLNSKIFIKNLTITSNIGCKI